MSDLIFLDKEKNIEKNSQYLYVNKSDLKLFIYNDSKDLFIIKELVLCTGTCSNINIEQFYTKLKNFNCVIFNKSKNIHFTTTNSNFIINSLNDEMWKITITIPSIYKNNTFTVKILNNKKKIYKQHSSHFLKIEEFFKFEKGIISNIEFYIRSTKKILIKNGLSINFIKK